MKKRLINVRLDEGHARKARILRRKGVVLSDLVREAIDAKYEEVAGTERPQDMSGLIQELFETYPDPAGLLPREYDVHDREAARGAIQRKLSRKRA